jgi:hypothetical protein
MELVRFGHLGLGRADLVSETQLLQYLRYKVKIWILYQFALRLKAIRDKACPVIFFPQTVRRADRWLLIDP